MIDVVDLGKSEYRLLQRNNYHNSNHCVLYYTFLKSSSTCSLAPPTASPYMRYSLTLYDPYGITKRINHAWGEGMS